MEHLKEAGFNHHDPRSPRVIGQYHGSYEMCVETKDLRRIIHGYSEVDRFVTLTERDSILFRKAQLHNSTWIPNPVTVQSTVTPDLIRQNTVVSLGRYNKQKSLDHLLQAWKLIQDDFPHWRLELYGEGEQRNYLQDLIVSESLENAHLMGLSNSVSEVLERSKIHAMSSQYEGLPIAIVEAAMSGVPTVSYNCAPGISELIEDEVTGLVVPQNSVASLAAALARLMRDDELLGRMSDMGVVKSREYSRENIMQKWLDVFEDMAL